MWRLALLGACGASLWMAWSATQRLQTIEQELFRRQQDSQTQVAEARMLARQTQDISRETAARTALLEARLAEVALQRGQLDDLMQSLSRSRDENLVADIDAALRVAQQQSVLTGSAEAVVAALKTADDRLARARQPRLDGVRRAIARDLDRVKAQSVADVPSLTIKLDEAMRLVDEVPLLRDRAEVVARQVGRSSDGASNGSNTGTNTSTNAKASAGPATSAGKPQTTPGAAAPGAAASEPATEPSAWLGGLGRLGREAWDTVGARFWQEVRSLVRVSRVEHPEAMLLAPEHAFFLRENLKLRLLNARAALLSRQFNAAQADLAVAGDALQRYFDAGSRKTQLTRELLQQVQAQCAHTTLPRPDETTAALAALSAVR